MKHLVTSFIHEDWVGQMDFGKAMLVDKSYINRQFQRLESDVIWKLPFNDGQEAYLYILLEFQSSVDHWMAFRMLRYVVEFYGGLLKGKPRPQRLPAVFPILLYNGDQRWTSPESFTDLVDPRIQGEFIPQFRYYKIAENEFDPAYLVSLHNLVAALFLVETSDVAELKARVDQIVSILRQFQKLVIFEIAFAVLPEYWLRIFCYSQKMLRNQRMFW